MSSSAAPLLGLVALLAGCSSAPRPPVAPLSPADLADAPPDAVHVTFQPRGHEPWSLRQADGKFLCRLPCSTWVSPESGLQLQNEATGHTTDSPEPIAAHLPARPGERIVARVERTHAGGALGKVIAGTSAGMFGLFGGTITALSIGSLATGSKGSSMSTGVCISSSTDNVNAGACATNHTRGAAADIGGLALGTAMLSAAALSTYWLVHARSGGIDYSASAPQTSAKRLRMKPGFVEMTRGRSRTVLTPGGIAGVF